MPRKPSRVVGPSDYAVEQATGKRLDQWFSALDRAGARDMAHKSIASWLTSRGGIRAGWWAQSVTVAYEQWIGRRKVGQTCRGDYQVSASKSALAAPDELLERWLAHVAQATAFDRVRFALEPTLSTTPNWRYWRVTLRDDTKVTINIGAKDERRSSLGVAHEKIATEAERERWKAFWKRYLADF